MTNTTEYQCVSDISDELLEHYLKQNAIAVDTELHGLRLYRDEICLIQLCDDQSNVCIIRPNPPEMPPNLKRLLTDPNVMKVFHFSLVDVAFFRTSMQTQVTPFACTKVMSKLIRTYTGGHGLKDLTKQILNIELDKEQQQTDWFSDELSSEQLKYAANDVLHLLAIYNNLLAKMEQRTLPTGMPLLELNQKAQAILPNLIELIIQGYGDQDNGWQTTLFQH